MGEMTAGDAVEQMSLGEQGVTTGNPINQMTIDSERRRKNLSAGTMAMSRDSAADVSVPLTNDKIESNIAGLLGSAAGITASYFLYDAYAPEWYWLLATFIAIASTGQKVLMGPLRPLTRMCRVLYQVGVYVLGFAVIVLILKAAGAFDWANG